MKKLMLAAFAALAFGVFAEEENAKDANSPEMGLSAPWVTAQKELTALFGEDPDIAITIADEGECVHSITLRVKGADKSDALQRILVPELEFGNVQLLVKVETANEAADAPTLARRAFFGNPVVKSFAASNRGAMGICNYILFRKEVVQYFNDELGDPNGLKSTLFADMAKKYIQRQDGVFFTTSPE